MNKKWCKETQKYINDVIAFFKDEDLLKDIDKGMLTQLGNYHNRYTTIERVIQEEGDVITQGVNMVEHPLTPKAEKAHIQLFKIQQEMGLTLRSRSKIDIIEGDGANDDPFTRLMKATE